MARQKNRNKDIDNIINSIEKNDVEDKSLEEMEVNLQKDEIEFTPEKKEEISVRAEENNRKATDSKKLINCLRNEEIFIKFVNREGGLVSDKSHTLYGGMAEGATVKLVVPQLASGQYKNVLTNSEKDYLEYVMGLPENALSVYKKIDNYWENRVVILKKEGDSLNLSSPEDYINYKIILANDRIVAKSEEELKSKRRASYRFVITSQKKMIDSSANSLTSKARSYVLFEKYKNNLEVLILAIKTITGKSLASNSEKNIVYSNIDKVINEKSVQFCEFLEDELLDTYLLIDRAVKANLIAIRAGHYYDKETNAPLANAGIKSTLKVTANYLSAPENQELKFKYEEITNNL